MEAAWRWIRTFEAGRRARTRARTVRMIFAVGPSLTLAVAILTIVLGVLPVAFTVAAGLLVGSVPAAVQEGLHSSAGHHLLRVLAAVAVMYVLQQLLGPLRDALVNALAERFNTSMGTLVMRAVSEPPGLAHLEDPESLNQIAIAQGQIGWIAPGGAIGPMTSIAGRYVQSILATAVLMRFNAALALALFGVLTCCRQIWRHEVFRLVKVQTGQAQALRYSDYLRDTILNPRAAKETRIFGLLDWITGRFSLRWTTAMKEVWRDRNRGLLVGLTSLTVVLIPVSLIFLSLGAGVGQGRVGLAEISIFGMAVFNVARINEIGNDELRIQFALETVPATVGLPETASAGWLTSGEREASNLPEEKVVFENVRFTYPGNERSILNGVDLEIRRGESLAIVGANGAGKTTLIKLLCRFYDPTEGRILVDGHDLREVDAASWHRRVGAIFQDFIHWELSARDNVGFGDIARIDQSDALEEAARRAGADTVIDGLPAKWDTILSRRYTGGADLSGGEWQRIALARAMMASSGGLGLLILDEPTANLDVRGEAEIYERFLELTRDATSIVISHRFSTVRRADRICVLDEGRVAEHGSHDELIATNGIYAEMFRLQAARFAEELEDA